MKRYKELKRYYYNIFKAERYHIITYGFRFPGKNHYTLRFLRRKAYECPDYDFDESLDY